MGAADDIKSLLTANLKVFTKQRKAEERNSFSGRFRVQRMTEVRSVPLTKAIAQVIEGCYLKVSDNNQLPAHARQIFYVARPLLAELSERDMKYGYFSQGLLKDFLEKNPELTANWDVVNDDRGHFIEPHTGESFGLGTLNVRDYLNRVRKLSLMPGEFVDGWVKTIGPHGCYSALLYVEKEGFFPLFKKVRLAQRYDLAIMSSKGMSVIAARQLADGICSKYNIPLLILHDFDCAGMIIKDTLENSTKRYTYKNKLDVIDFGLKFEDIGGLRPENCQHKISRERLEQAGVDDAAIDFLISGRAPNRMNIGQRVELDALSSRQLVNHIESKLKLHKIGKVIPDQKTIEKTYRMMVASNEMAAAFEDLKQGLDESPVSLPDDLQAKVKAILKKQPDIPWHRAVRLIIDPNAPEKADDVAGDDE